MSITKKPSVLVYAPGLIRRHGPGCESDVPLADNCAEGCETDDQIKERLKRMLEGAE